MAGSRVSASSLRNNALSKTAGGRWQWDGSMQPTARARTHQRVHVWRCAHPRSGRLPASRQPAAQQSGQLRWKCRGGRVSQHLSAPPTNHARQTHASARSTRCPGFGWLQPQLVVPSSGKSAVPKVGICQWETRASAVEEHQHGSVAAHLLG